MHYILTVHTLTNMNKHSLCLRTFSIDPRVYPRCKKARPVREEKVEPSGNAQETRPRGPSKQFKRG